MKIAKKITGSMIIIALVLLVFLSIVFVVQGSNSIENRIKAQLESVMVLKSAQLDEFINEEIGDLEFLAQGNYIRESLTGGNAIDIEKIRADLDMGLNSLGNDFSEIFIIDKEGVVIISTDRSQEGKIKKDREYFKTGLSRSIATNFYYSVALQQPAMTVATPMKNEDGNLIAVLAARIDTKEISKIMTERSGLGESGETYLVNKFNYVVTDLKFEPGAALKKAIYSDAVMHCLENKHVTNTGTYKGYRGNEVVGMHVWLPEREACLLAEISKDEALAQISSFKTIIIVASIGILLFSTLMGYGLSREITKPIRELGDAAQKIGKGDLDIKAVIKSKDEMENLSKIINKMARDLKDYQKQLLDAEKKKGQELEKEVGRRTKQLQETNEELEKFNKLSIDREMKMIQLKKDIVKMKKESKK